MQQSGNAGLLLINAKPSCQKNRRIRNPYGVDKTAVLKSLFKLCLAFAAVCAVVLNVIWLALGPIALGVFTTDSEAIQYGLMRMWGGLSFQFTAVVFEVTASAMRGMGWSLTPALITVVGSCVLRVWWVFTVFNWTPEFPVLVSVYPTSWIVTSVAMLVALYFVRKRAYAKARASA